MDEVNEIGLVFLLLTAHGDGMCSLGSEEAEALTNMGVALHPVNDLACKTSRSSASQATAALFLTP